MLSDEQLHKSVNTHIAELLADQVMNRLQETLASQWESIVFELASTRRINEQLKTALQSMQQYCQRLEALVQVAEQNQRRVSEANRRASLVLDEALQKLGVTETESD